MLCPNIEEQYLGSAYYESPATIEGKGRTNNA